MSKGIRSTKRSGRDIKVVVGSYLRRRHYIDSSDSFKVSEMITKQTSEQMSVNSAVEKDSSCLNAILYRNNNNNDPRQAEEQLMKLWSWLSEIKDLKCKSELTVMMLPLFLHLYLDLFHYGKCLVISPSVTDEFLTYHCDEEAKELIQMLSRISSIQDVEKFPILKAFRSSKFQLTLSSGSSSKLVKFLEKNSYMILLGVVQKWFEFDVHVDGYSVQEDDETDPALKQYLSVEYDRLEAAATASAVCSTSHVPVKDTDMRQLQDAIRLVRETPSLPTPLLIYTLNNTENICSASVSRTFKLLATGTLTSELKLWNLQETKLPPIKIRHIPLGCDSEPLLYQQQESRYCTLRGHSGPVYDTKFVHKAEVVLSVSQDSDMRAWNLNDYSCASVYRGHTYPIWSITVSALGLHIATGSQDRTIRLWNLDRCYPLRIFSGHTEDVNCVRFHPNVAYLASASHDKTVRMWEVASGNMVRVFAGHSGGVYALAFSPHGNLLASAGDGGRVKIWDIPAGKLIADLKGHTSRVIAIDWSNDGSTVTSISCDGMVLGWKVDKLDQLNEVAVLEQPFRYSTGFSSALSLEYSPRNTCIAVGVK